MGILEGLGKVEGWWFNVLAVELVHDKVLYCWHHLRNRRWTRLEVEREEWRKRIEEPEEGMRRRKEERGCRREREEK